MMRRVIFIAIMLMLGTNAYSSSNRYLGPVLPSSMGRLNEMILFDATLIVPNSTQLEKWQHFVQEHANQFVRIDLTCMDYNTTQCKNKREILADLANQLNDHQFPSMLLGVEMGYVPLDEESQQNAKMIQQSMPYLGLQPSIPLVITERPPLSPCDSDDVDFTTPLQCSTTIIPGTKSTVVSSSKSPIELGESPTLPENEQ